MSDEIDRQTGSHGQSDAAPAVHRCSRCHEWKPVTEFHNSHDGEFTYCRDCRNAYDRQYYAGRGGAARRARRRAWLDAAREWMNSFKEGVPCTDCGRTFPVFVMHWDHLPEFEKFGEISTMLGRRSREAVIEELKKCQLVCANCHVLRTVKRATKLQQN